MCKNVGKWQPENGDGGRRLGDLVLQVALVKDVALSCLSDEEDAFGEADFRLWIGSVGSFDALSKPFGSPVLGEIEKVCRNGVLKQGIFSPC